MAIDTHVFTVSVRIIKIIRCLTSYRCIVSHRCYGAVINKEFGITASSRTEAIG